MEDGAAALGSDGPDRVPPGPGTEGEIPSGPSPDVADRKRRRRVLASLAAAVLVVAAVATALVVASRDDDAPHPVTVGPGPSETPSTRATLTEPEGWREMSRSPLSARSDAITAWTGTELLVWRGEGETTDMCELADDGTATCGEPTRSDGAAYDPAADRWRPMSESPFPPEQGSSMGGYGAAWTGDELIVWGGAGPQAAAYDPDRDAWRTLDPGPLAARARFSTTWTGQELIIYGGIDRPTAASGPGSRGRTRDDGAIYDPTADAWRALPASGAEQAEPMATWDGDELLVFPGQPDGHGEPTPALAFDPSTSAWRELAPSPLGWSFAPAVWTGEQAVMVGQLPFDATLPPEGRASRAVAVGYDPEADRWSTLPALPGAPAALASPTVAWSGREVLVLGSPIGTDQPLSALAYDPGPRTWRTLPPAELSGRGAMAAAWTGTELVAWGGTAFTGFGGDPAADGARYAPGPGR